MQCPFDENQFGFRKHCSTVQLLTKVTKDWLHARDGGLSAGLACINLRKAFDAVRHQILLESLSSAGIGGIPLNWFASYLSERTQRLVTQRGCSSTLVVSSGVPQGTVLGPVLFNLYVRELPKTAEAHGFHLPMFTYDMTLYTSHKSLHLAAQTLNLALSSLSAAVLDLVLMVNVDKPVVLFLTPSPVPNPPPLISINHVPLTVVDSTRILGVYIDCRLTWTPHIDGIVRKVSKKIGALQGSFRCLSIPARRSCCHSPGSFVLLRFFPHEVV